MKIKWKQLIVCILIPIAVGGLSVLLIRYSSSIYQMLKKPALSPPAWFFPVIWNILYILMGISSYIILISNKSQNDIIGAWKTYALQLAVNFFWPIIFFGLSAYALAFMWILLLLLLIIIMIIRFSKISKVAAYLNIPYLLWVAFAAYLNLAIYLLNR